MVATHLNPKCYAIKEFKRFLPNIREGNSKYVIKLRQANQGYKLLDSKYKIVWSTKNLQRFHFTDRNIIWANIRLSGIGSDNRKELLYILGLLNSKLTLYHLRAQLKLENEKDFLLPIKAVKEFVRVPKITKYNQKIKEEIIKCTEEMFDLEEIRLSDYIEFSKVMVQKIDKVSVEGTNLILEKDDKKIKLAIKESQVLVKKCINEKYDSQIAGLGRQKIILSELKYLPIINYEKQEKIKDYVYDLIFTLYFNIALDKLGLNQAGKIKAKCSENPYYNLVNAHGL